MDPNRSRAMLGVAAEDLWRLIVQMCAPDAIEYDKMEEIQKCEAVSSKLIVRSPAGNFAEASRRLRGDVPKQDTPLCF